MADYGANVVGVILPPPGPAAGALASPKQAMANVARLSELAPNPALRALGSMFKKVAGLGVHLFPKNGVTVQQVPFMLRRCIVDTAGEPEVQSAIIADLTADGEIVNGSEQELKVDTVCISGGLYPLDELAEACACGSGYVQELGGRVPIHGPDMQTTQAGLFVAGSATGIEGAQVALAQGKMAGIGIAAYLGRISGGDAAPLLEQTSVAVETARREALLTFNPDVGAGRGKQAQLWQSFSPDRRAERQ
jgi:sarcosine oxidase subunit alpha